MYCKHCGNQIAEDSVFCAKCGKLVVDSYENKVITSNKKEGANNNSNMEGWLQTHNMQWKKPILVRVVQLLLIAISLFWGVYSIACLINGGEVYRYFGERRALENYSDPRDPRIQYEENLYILDYWRIFRTKSVKWNESRTESYYRDGALYGGGAIPWAFSYDDIKSEKGNFRLKVVFLGIVPALIVLWLTIIWIKRKPFPKEKDGLPRDFADEIEEYELYGFFKHKYVFFKKNGKYGVLDAAHYRVHIPAQYDTIAWRTINKTYDASKDREERTYVIEEKKEQTISQWDNMATKRKIFLVIGVILALWAAFLIIADLIDIISGSYGANHVAIILISSLSGFGAYVCIKYSRKEL